MEETTISDGAAVIDDVTEAERSSLDLDAQSRMVAVYGMKGQVCYAKGQKFRRFSYTLIYV